MDQILLILLIWLLEETLLHLNPHHLSHHHQSHLMNVLKEAHHHLSLHRHDQHPLHQSLDQVQIQVLYQPRRVLELVHFNRISGQTEGEPVIY